MYQVAINADPDTFLDWDKPLSEQPRNVHDALTQMGFAKSSWPYSGYTGKTAMISGDERGEGIYRAAAKEAAAAEAARQPNFDVYSPHGASQSLRQAGVPGIKYLDSGSRAAGDGSRNYVVFDDKTVQILKKYGLLGGLMTGAGAGSIIGNPPPQEASF